MKNFGLVLDKSGCSSLRCLRLRCTCLLLCVHWLLSIYSVTVCVQSVVGKSGLVWCLRMESMLWYLWMSSKLYFLCPCSNMVTDLSCWMTSRWNSVRNWVTSELWILQFEILTLGWAARTKFTASMVGESTSYCETTGIEQDIFFPPDGFYANQYWSVMRRLCWWLDLVFPSKQCSIIIPVSETRWCGKIPRLFLFIALLFRSLSLAAVLVESFSCNRGYWTPLLPPPPCLSGEKRGPGFNTNQWITLMNVFLLS